MQREKAPSRIIAEALERTNKLLMGFSTEQSEWVALYKQHTTFKGEDSIWLAVKELSIAMDTLSASLSAYELQDSIPAGSIEARFDLDIIKRFKGFKHRYDGQSAPMDEERAAAKPKIGPSSS